MSIVASRRRRNPPEEDDMADDSIPPVPDRLQQWRDEGETVELMGRQIWYHDQGPKTDDAVFIVHGYPGSSWDFQGVVDRIGNDTRTVVMDMVGFGLSDKPLDGDYQSNFTLVLQADLYDALAAHLGLKTVLLVAHDMGQSVGLEIVARFEENRTPFRIRHAILLDGSTLIDMIEPTEFQKQALAAPSTALDEDMAWHDIYDIFPESYATESRAGTTSTSSSSVRPTRSTTTTGAEPSAASCTTSRSGRRASTGGLAPCSSSRRPRCR